VLQPRGFSDPHGYLQSTPVTGLDFGPTAGLIACKNWIDKGRRAERAEVSQNMHDYRKTMLCSGQGLARLYQGSTQLTSPLNLS
jgi:hypothetical protein